MKWAVCIMMLLGYVIAVQDDIWKNWAATIKTRYTNEICKGVLVTYSHVLTTCECTTHPDFVFPEFLRKPGEQHMVHIREHQQGHQSREVYRFDPHPKCTSNYFVQGFLTYNFGIVTTTKPFEHTEHVTPIKKMKLNAAGVVREFKNCAVMGCDHHSSIAPINAMLSEDCSERASLALGTDPINFKEKGMMCADLERDVPSKNASGNSGRHDGQPASNSSQNSTNFCDGIVVSGAPVVCDGELAGLVSHGLCKFNAAPVIITRIELTTSLVNRLSLGAKPAGNQILLKTFAAIFILRSL